jgi:hypothetical protein
MLLAPGDDALVVIWDLDSGTRLQDISCPFNGPITVAAWLPTVQGSATVFAFGCADGSIHVYVQHPHQVSLSVLPEIQLTLNIGRISTPLRPLAMRMEDLLRTSLSRSHIKGSLALVTALFKYGG